MTWTPGKTSAAYTPAVLLQPDKPPQPCNVQAIRCVSVARARELLAAGKAAWVDARDWREVGESGALD